MCIRDRRKMDREIRDSKKTLMAFGDFLIQKRKEENEKGGVKRYDFLQIMLDNMKGEGKNENLTGEEVMQIFIQLVFGGTDTSAHGLASCLYYLCTNLQYLQPMRDEVREALKAHNGEYSMEMMNSLNFMQAFIKETFRFIPPLGENIMRVAVEDHMLGKYKIKKGTHVNVPHTVLGMRDPNIKDWEVFRPERWIGDESSKYNMFSSIPFSAGPKNCIGQHFGVLNMKRVLAELVLKFTPSLNPGYKLGVRFDPIVAPKMPMPVTLKPYKG
eukprot:TRINITY_DN6762_c0_g1_i3.p1 TRINITY_DN6762_c0_g1~~TRINITY_DN6762_c0_g1_i3.p1  ORF type:complete len:294 (-),score=98.15 TRINITY_DN6762_c0_g1_i3:215-1027(-)